MPKLLTAKNKKDLKSKVVGKKKFKVKRMPKSTHGMPTRKDLSEEQRAQLREAAKSSFYLQRTKIGREKIFSDPQAMWAAACEYFLLCDASPWLKHDVKSTKFGLKDTYTKVGRPYTWDMLTLYMDVNPDYFYQFEKSIKNDDPTREGFSRVISAIKSTVRNQKFEGAANGAFNANLISYDLGLRSDNVNATGSSGYIIEVIDNDSEQLLEEVKAKLAELDE
jgi:hypothetical protein